MPEQSSFRLEVNRIRSYDQCPDRDRTVCTCRHKGLRVCKKNERQLSLMDVLRQANEL